MELIYYISIELNKLPEGTIITKEVLQGIISRAQASLEELEKQIDDYRAFDFE